MSEHQSFTDPRLDDRADPEAYGRFLTGEATDEECRALVCWATTAQRRRLLNAKVDGVAPLAERTERAWARLRERMVFAGSARVVDSSPAHGRGKPEKRAPFHANAHIAARTRGAWRVYAVAATVVGCLLWIASGRVPLGGRTGAASGGVRVFATGTAQHAALTLTDGTRVLLNANTRLRVTRKDAGERRVELLDGEAQFTVTHHSATPFVVRSGPAQVTVLGTTFTARRFAPEGRFRVVVADGRVALRLRGHGVRGEAVLGAGMLGEVADTGTAPVITPRVNVDDYTSWTRGRLVFRDTPLRQAIPELERRYGLTIRLDDPTLGEQPISATMSDAPVSDVLDLLAMSFDMRYTRDGNIVTFYRAHPNAPRERRGSPLRTETTYGR